MLVANRRQFLQTAALMAGAPGVARPGTDESQRAQWLDTAERLKPRLHATPVPPVGIVKPVADASQFLRWRMEQV